MRPRAVVSWPSPRCSFCMARQWTRPTRPPAGRRSRRPPARAIGNWWRCCWPRARTPNIATSPAPPAAEIGALLTESALKGQTDIADLLLAKGANVDARDKSGATPLHQAALKGNLAFATLLLQHGADVNARDRDGATPLHNAALNGGSELAALLLDKGANVDAREAGDAESGATPLYLAAAWGRTAMVELLAARGADVNARTKAGVGPLAAAEKNSFSEVAAILKQNGAR